MISFRGGRRGRESGSVLCSKRTGGLRVSARVMRRWVVADGFHVISMHVRAITNLHEN